MLKTADAPSAGVAMIAKSAAATRGNGANKLTHSHRTDASTWVQPVAANSRVPHVGLDLIDANLVSAEPGTGQQRHAACSGHLRRQSR